MLTPEDKDWFKTNMRLAVIDGSKEAIKEHVEAAHKPIDGKLETVDKRLETHSKRMWGMAAALAALAGGWEAVKRMFLTGGN